MQHVFVLMLSTAHPCETKGCLESHIKWVYAKIITYPSLSLPLFYVNLTCECCIAWGLPRKVCCRSVYPNFFHFQGVTARAASHKIRTSARDA